jgi:hypothetical protein
VKVVLAGICHDVHIQLKIFQGTLNALKYRYDLLGLIVLPFLDREVLTTSGTYPSSFVTQIFHNGHPSHGGDRKTFEVMAST